MLSKLCIRIRIFVRMQYFTLLNGLFLKYFNLIILVKVKTTANSQYSS